MRERVPKPERPELSLGRAAGEERVVSDDLVAHDGLDVLRFDATVREMLGECLLGLIRLGPEDLRAAYHRLVERQMLERVERIVVHEGADRRLRGQEVPRVLDRFV
jgi:hypothetical protein